MMRRLGLTVWILSLPCPPCSDCSPRRCKKKIEQSGVCAAIKRRRKNIRETEKMPYFDARCEDACSCGCVIAAARSGAPRLQAHTADRSWREDSNLPSAAAAPPPPTPPQHKPYMYVRGDQAELLTLFSRELSPTSAATSLQIRLRGLLWAYKLPWWFLESSPDASCECENSEKPPFARFASPDRRRSRRRLCVCHVRGWTLACSLQLSAKISDLPSSEPFCMSFCHAAAQRGRTKKQCQAAPTVYRHYSLSDCPNKKPTPPLLLLSK